MDKVMSHTSHVLERFPDHWSALSRLLRTDPDFRALCEDHGEAVAALARWRAMSGDQYATEIREFEALIAELEEEVLARLLTASGA